MKLANSALDVVLLFDKYHVNELVIEDQKMFSRLISDLTYEIDGLDGETVLSKGDRPIQLSGNADMLRNFAPFNINQKALINKITHRLETDATNEDNYATSIDLLSKIRFFIESLCFDKPCDLICTKLTMGTLLKAAGIEIDSATDDEIEKVFDYIELVREFDGDKLFIAINMRSYYDDDEMNSFIQTILSHDIQFLLIESMARNQLKNTIRTVVDSDLCQF